MRDETELLEIRTDAATALANAAENSRNDDDLRKFAAPLHVALRDEHEPLRAAAVRGLLYADPDSILSAANESGRAEQWYVPLLQRWSDDRTIGDRSRRLLDELNAQEKSHPAGDVLLINESRQCPPLRQLRRSAAT